MNADIFDFEGFVVTPPLLDEGECDAIESGLTAIRGVGIGTRKLLDSDWCRELGQLLKNTSLIRKLLPDDAIAVQCTYFEKSIEQNWLVSVHQDLSIPVREKIEHPALTGWSEKEGCVFVQPPIDVLETMVAVRLHLDECGEDDGPLKVVPRSHKSGRLSNEVALSARGKHGEYICTVKKGAALVMKPLLLHASSKAKGNSRRRVLHFVFGPGTLPFGLRWQHAV